MTKKEIKTAKITPEVRFFKFKSGESIIAFSEWDEASESGEIILYNPMKLVSSRPVVDPNGSITKVSMEEWLPRAVVVEQLCTVYEEDTIFVVPVNEEFRLAYQAVVLRKTALDELANSFTPTDTMKEDMYRAELESVEEDSVENEEKIKEWKKKFN